jgi:hypothetical protein
LRPAKKLRTIISSRIVPFENAKVPNVKGCSKQNGDSAYWWGPGNSSKNLKNFYMTFKTYFFLCVFPFEGAECQGLREVESLSSFW